jgi:enolase-phosphatase E1
MSTASLDHARWNQAEVVLLDIEGTISSIAFVKDVMYPYALDSLTRLARNSWADADFQNLISSFPEGTKESADALIAHVQELTACDIKAVYLKQLQGHLWTTGFRNGDLKTPLFEDVVPKLEAWKAAGKTLVIFSSGSVQAQLQFFSYVRDGPTTRDIKPLFAAHYDIDNAGPKMEKASYEKICSELGKDVNRVTFLTDNVKGTLLAQLSRLTFVTAHHHFSPPLQPHHPKPTLVSHSHLPINQPTHHHSLT